MRYSAGLLLLAALLLAPGTAMADGLISLQQALLRHGFRIEVRQPPGKAYGRFLSNQKLLEIITRRVGSVDMSKFEKQKLIQKIDCRNID